MEVFATGTGCPDDSSEVLEDIFRLRHQIFVDRLGWDITAKGAKETDQFDCEGTNYGAVYQDGELLGSFRLIAMDRPNMIGTVFAPYIPEKTPMLPEYVESSRLCVAPHLTTKSRSQFFETIRTLVTHLGEVAQDLDALRVYSLSYIAFAKILVSAGVPLKRTSSDFVIDGRACGVGSWRPLDPIIAKQNRVKAVQEANKLIVN